VTEDFQLREIINKNIVPSSFVKAFQDEPAFFTQTDKPKFTLHRWAPPRMSMRGVIQRKISDEVISSPLEERINRLERKVDILKAEITSCTRKIDRLCSELEDKSNIKYIQLFDISEKYTVIQPIPIIIEESNDEVIARFPEVELFSVGDTESEAIVKLKLSLVELYSDLLETPKNKLGKLPTAWLRILKKLILPNG
jgi:hypothetical protein